MSTEEITPVVSNPSAQDHQVALQRKLWSMADELRADGQMQADEFKDFILGIIFFRYASERLQQEYDNLAANDPDLGDYAQAWEKQEIREALIEQFMSTPGYVIPPPDMFSALAEKVAATAPSDMGREGKFSLDNLVSAIRIFDKSAEQGSHPGAFEHLLEDMDLSSNKLGKRPEERAALMAKIISLVASIDFRMGDANIDVLGDAYEYMIAKFASSAGQSAGEFYTPQSVAEILARIVTTRKKNLSSVYDPTCGSGSLLIRVGKQPNVRVGKYYGQEKNTTTYNLARMNGFLHGIDPDKWVMANDNTLTNPHFTEIKHPASVANPPYSVQWSADTAFNTDPRFASYGKLAPKNKADWAFLQHILANLTDDGISAAVVAHGVLFRGGAEEHIRKAVIERNQLDAVIGLPANIFYGTGIATAVVVFRKNRDANEPVLFVDGSSLFERGRAKNSLRDSDVDEFARLYEAFAKNRDDVEVAHVSRLVPLSEIKENDYNLNIARYIEPESTEEDIDLEAIERELLEVDEQIRVVSLTISDFISQLRPAEESKDYNN